jgi:hypothetical protein
MRIMPFLKFTLADFLGGKVGKTYQPVWNDVRSCAAFRSPSIPMKNFSAQPHIVPIKDIIISKRHRHDLGNIVELGHSINELGLLHPVVIRSDGTLIADARCLAACQHLGWEAVPVAVVDIDEIAKGEFARNARRSH